MKKYQDKIQDFFKWVKGTELVELDDIDVSEDPVRPELSLGFRILMNKFLEFINKEFFITSEIKFSIFSLFLVSLIFIFTHFLLRFIKKNATKKLDEERKLKFKSVFSFLNYFVFVIVAFIKFFFCIFFL